MENRKKIIIIAIFLILSLCITVVATVAFFNYAKEGSTDNVIETGTIEFHYDEVSKKGNGIELIDALPVASNDTEKTNNTYFEFNVTAKTMSLPISYVVTAKKSVDSDDMDDLVDLYLSDDSDNQLFDGVHKYSNLVQYRNKPATEKVIYTDTVPANQSNFRKDFRLRMWIDEGVDFSGTEVTKYYCSGVEVVKDSEAYNNCDVANLTQTTDIEYEYNGKMFKITVNVYTENDISNYVAEIPLPQDALITRIRNLAATDTTNLKNDDPDGNIRYVGSDPDNYVTFNGESWRIIGIIDGYVKLIRTKPLDNFNDTYIFTFDSSDYNINGGYGSNYWGNAKLMYELNGDYLNSDLTEDVLWYSNTYNSKSATFDHTKVIKADAKEMIAEVTWYLGAPNFDGVSTTSNSDLNAEMIYTNERRDVIAVLNPGDNLSNDNYDRKTTWTGKVALIYASDYVYSTSGDDNMSREECLANTYWYYKASCYGNAWMEPLHHDWTISPCVSNGRNIYVTTTYRGVGNGSTGWPSGMEMRPSLHLKKEVRFIDGDGSKDNPYILEM